MDKLPLAQWPVALEPLSTLLTVFEFYGCRKIHEALIHFFPRLIENFLIDGPIFVDSEAIHLQ